MALLRLSAMARGDLRLVSDPEMPAAARVLKRWPHTPGSLQVFRYSSNFLYTFAESGKRYFLRSVPDEQRTRAQIESELDLIAWLDAAGIPVVTPMPSRSGQLLETVVGQQETYHAVVFAELIGEQREVGSLEHDDFTVWGAALGRLQAAMRQFPGAADAARPSWRDDLAVVEEHLLSRCPAYRTEFDVLARALNDLPSDGQRYGLIHFDFELDNLLWRDGSLGILDFDDCAHHWYAADIAFALRDLFDAGAAVNDPRVRAFLDGYAAYQALDAETIAQLPLFARLTRIVQHGRVARALDLNPEGDYPAWLRELEARLVARLAR